MADGATTTTARSVRGIVGRWLWRVFQDHGGSACATIVRVEAVGLRELRQNASELVRRVEEGEEIVITVAGRPGARLVPTAHRTWRRWDDVAELFAGPGDPAWSADREGLAHDIRDPWANA